MALKYGNSNAKLVLRDKGPHGELTISEPFIAAYADGDSKSAKEILARERNILKTLSESDHKLIAEFASLNKIESVKLMLDLGFEVNQRAA